MFSSACVNDTAVASQMPILYTQGILVKDHQQRQKRRNAGLGSSMLGKSDRAGVCLLNGASRVVDPEDVQFSRESLSVTLGPNRTARWTVVAPSRGGLPLILGVGIYLADVLSAAMSESST